MVELAEFFDYMYGDEEGYVYLALKNPNSGAFLQHHFQWPQQKDFLIEKVISSAPKYEVYYAPSLFRAASGRKEEVLGSRVVWVEFDGKVPNLSKFDIPAPTLRIRSSDDAHEHWYWRLDSLCDPEQIERVNRGLTYLLGADVSGWDASQILRPPGTKNHKRNRNVEVLDVSVTELSYSDFAAIPEPPPVGKQVLPTELPDVQEVIAKYAWRKSLFDLFRQGVPEGKRSAGLMALGHGLAEAGMTAPECLSILINADSRWGKFANRDDQLLRLSEIVTRAKAKHPDKVSTTNQFESSLRFGFVDLLTSEIELEWVWENYLQTAGYFLLSGAPGVGKTLFALNLGMAMALGKPFLQQPIHSPQKIGFYSLEMPAPDLKFFVQKLSEGLSQEDLATLQENFILFPFGEPLSLTSESVQKELMTQIGDEKFNGVFFDSMMSCTEKSISDEVTAKELMDWNDHLRKKFDLFTVYLHHQRKDQVGNKKPKALGDVYGNVVITGRTTTAFCLWQEDKQQPIDVVPLKVRLSATPNEFQIYRDPVNLQYSTVKPKQLGGITIVDKSTDGSIFSHSKLSGV